MELKKLIIDSLDILKKEDKKITELNEIYNIDLTNYEFEPREQLVILLKYLLNDTDEYDMVGLWLYDRNGKFLYDKEHNITDDLNNAEDFVNYMIKVKI